MKLIYCPACAAPLTKLDDTNYHCANGHPYFNNPHAACSVVFINDKQEILFSKRAHEPAKGKYDFPEGFLDHNEDAYHAAQRELKEELGIDITLDDLQLIDTSPNHYQENDTAADFVFLCHTWRGAMQPADDVAEVAWKPIEFLRSSEFAWPYPYLYDKLRKLFT